MHGKLVIWIGANHLSTLTINVTELKVEGSCKVFLAVTPKNQSCWDWCSVAMTENQTVRRPKGQERQASQKSTSRALCEPCATWACSLSQQTKKQNIERRELAAREEGYRYREILTGSDQIAERKRRESIEIAQR